MLSASCVMILLFLMPYGAGVNVGCCGGVTSVMAIRCDLLGADLGVGMLYWTKLESHVASLIGRTTPGVLLLVFMR